MQNSFLQGGCFSFSGISTVEGRQARSLERVGVYTPECLTKCFSGRMEPGEDFHFLPP